MRRTNFKSGVYLILNTQNGKAYAGSSIDVNKRLDVHKKLLQDNQHTNPHLQYAWNKYEQSNFKFLPLLFCPRKERLKHEQDLIDMSFHFSYNIYPTAGSPLGSTHSKKTKEKMSKSRKKYWDDNAKPIGEKNPFYGKEHTKKTKARIGSKNKKHMKGNQYAKGNSFSLTQEQIQKMKAAWTPEMRKAASERSKNRTPWFTGKKFTKEHRDNISKGQLGRKHSEDTKRKMSEAAKKRLQDPKLLEKHRKAVKKGWETRRRNKKANINP